MTIRIARQTAAMMRAHADRAAPLECCGLLLGQGDIIEAARAADNVAAQPERHFEIDPAALIGAERAARQGHGPAVIGYYHSHPNGRAAPSATDLAMAPPDGRIWLILAQGAIAAFRAPERAGDTFRRCGLQIDP